MTGNDPPSSSKKPDKKLWRDLKVLVIAAGLGLAAYGVMRLLNYLFRTYLGSPF